MAVRINGRPVVPEGYGVQEEGPYLEWVDVEDWLVEPPNTGWPPLDPTDGPTWSPVGECGSTRGSGTTGRH